MLRTLLLSSQIMTMEAYLDFEEKSDIKHEFHDGKLYTMPGGTPRHNEICGNIIREMGNEIIEKDRDCGVLTSDQKVYVPPLQKALYPDATVVCGKNKYPFSNQKTIISNPILLVEVLSPSTAAYDQGDKFFYYQGIKSFREYVLIEQEKPSVEVRFLIDAERNLWQHSYYRNMEDEVELQSLGCKIPMKKIYRRVEFDQPAEGVIS